MVPFLVRRAIHSVPVLAAVIALSFLIIHLAPGDPIKLMLGVHATPASVAQAKHDLGLDKPLGRQLLSYFGKAFEGDFGTSIIQQAPVREIGSLLYNLEARVCFGVCCRDVNGTPKVFSRDFYQTLRLTSAGDLLDLELMAAAVRRRVPVDELPVRGFRRHGGKSSTTWKSALKMYGGALQLWWTGAA